MVVFSDSFQDDKCANGVVLQEEVGDSDASVNMSFRGYVNNRVHLMNQAVHELRVANIAFDEGVTFIVLDVMQIRWVSAHPYFIYVYQFAVRVLCKYEPAEVASYES